MESRSKMFLNIQYNKKNQTIKVKVYKKLSCPLNIANRGKTKETWTFPQDLFNIISSAPLNPSTVTGATAHLQRGVTLYTTNETKEPQDPSQSPQ